MVAPGPVLAPSREGSLALRSPLIAGPGSLGYGRDAAALAPVQMLGALITTTTTLHHRTGKTQPRLIETPAGVLMSTGLPNPGLRTVLYRYAPAWRRLGVPIVLSLAAEDGKTFAYCAERAQEEESIVALELQPDLLASKTDIVRVVDTVRNVTSLPLLVHVPVGEAQGVADAIVDLAAVGCDAVIVGSPWPGLIMDVETRQPRLSGGVSGPAIRPLALKLIYDVARLLGPEHIPLIAAGGVSNKDDAGCLLAAGADAVLLDTVLWVDPAAAGLMT